MKHGTLVNPTPRPIRWGVVGPGRAAARFAQGLMSVPGAELAGVWGRNLEKTHAYAARFLVGAVAPSLDALLAMDLDAVYIATHPDSHAAICVQALSAGKHVLCEKPAAVNTRQLVEVIASAEQNGLLFMEAMKPPFFPLYRKLKAYLEEHPIGPVGYVRAGHCDATLAPDYPLHFPALAGGGIMGIGPYEAFLALDWLGPLRRVHTMGRLNAAGVDAFAIFQTEHEGGMAQLHTGLDLLSCGDAMLAAPRGYVLLHANWWNPTRATIHSIDGRRVVLDEPFEAGGFNYEIEHFCNLIRSGTLESPVITHALSLGMAQLLESARTELGVRFPGE
ncbi:MAG: Gfo/Idh/MocA family oxidoreductase [Acidobacteriota bacterium]|nr:Gfo/Idh/MocA family oxidoreductase [Acidobacteriota bacterium]